MLQVENKKKSSNMLGILLGVFLLLFSMCFSVGSVSAKAETATGTQAITVDTVIENTTFITYKKGKSEERGQFLIACFYIPNTQYQSSWEYGVIVFPRWYEERYGVQGNYIEEYEKLGLADTLAIMKAESFFAVTDGKVVQCGIINIPDAGVTMELSYIFYTKDSMGNIAYAKPQHAAYATTYTENYTKEQLAEMIGQKVAMENSFRQIVKNIETLVDSFWGYIILAGAAVVVVWGAYIGVKVIVAHRNEEKINARGMVKSLLIGILIVFGIAVVAPLLLKGLSAWLYW